MDAERVSLDKLEAIARTEGDRMILSDALGQLMARELLSLRAEVERLGKASEMRDRLLTRCEEQQVEDALRQSRAAINAEYAEAGRKLANAMGFDIPPLSPPRSPASAEALLPCPFCGTPATWIADDSYDGCHVMCQPCDLGFVAMKGQPQYAKDKWNKRPPAPRCEDEVHLARTTFHEDNMRTVRETAEIAVEGDASQFQHWLIVHPGDRVSVLRALRPTVPPDSSGEAEPRGKSLRDALAALATGDRYGPEKVMQEVMRIAHIFVDERIAAALSARKGAT